MWNVRGQIKKTGAAGIQDIEAEGTGIDMGKKQRRTTNTQIRNALRRLFLYSRERRRCLKGAVCLTCGSDEKLEPHHLELIDWKKIFTVIREELLTDDMVPICKKCHDQLPGHDVVKKKPTNSSNRKVK